jgi:hypothetical protein
MSQFNTRIKGKLYKYFMERLNLKSSTNGFIRGDCPYCNGKFTFGINIERWRVNCFKNCGVPSNPLDLLMEMENLETINEARAFLNIQQDYLAYENLIPKEKALVRTPIELPESYTLLNLGSGMLADAARKSMIKRGFNVRKLAQLGTGYCTEGHYAGYIIFPFFHRTQLEFFQGRKFAGMGPKMMNPNEEDYGVGKSQLIYNRDALYMYKKIYVLESITNAITLGDRAIALLGKKASPYQISAMIKSPCEELIVILDPDARVEAINLCMILSQYKKTKLVYWGKLSDEGPDVNDLGKKETLQRVKAAEYVNYNSLIKLKSQTRAELV